MALILIVPFGANPAPTADSVVQRLTAAQSADGSTTEPSPVEQPQGDEPAEPAPQVISVTEAAELFVPLGRIEIPRIGLNVPIRNGVHERVLEQGVGQWPGTDAQNIVLSGHRTTYLAPFRDLDLLAAADQVVLTWGGGQSQVYEVFDTRVVPEAEYVDYALGGTPEPDDQIVTMYACHPKGQRTHRIVVRARAVAPSAPAQPSPQEVQ